jgi:signal transduction histidine kinase
MPENVLAEAAAAGHCEKEGWRIRKDGSRFWGQVAISAVRDVSGCLRGYVKVTRDMTDKRQAEEAVSQARERLTQLSRQLLAAQELERRRIARELHDQLGQSLVLLQINLQKLQASPQAKNLAYALGESITLVERLHEQARNLSLDLRPSLLDDLGLVPVLRWHLDRLARSSGLSVHFAAGDSAGRYPSEVETTCFRIAQEALANA